MWLGLFAKKSGISKDKVDFLVIEDYTHAFLYFIQLG